MIIYFIKSTFLCLVFFLIYKGMLEKKKSSKFKRFYLLVAMSIGLSFPLFKVQFLVEQNIITDTKQIIVEEISHQEFIHEYIPGIALPETNQKPVLLVIYVLISGVFAFRFLRNIDKILVLKKKGTMIETPFGFLVLNDTVKSPFSFYDRIYLNKSQWVNGKINPEILHHEQAHIQQKHTLDILFIELLKVFLWFQPFLYVFKRLMQENHEYLADEYSLSKTQDVKHYQQLILNFYNQPSKELQLSSSFYFSNLKKRFIMMKNTKKGRVWETVFYSSAVLVTYFAFVGIEAQAAEIK
ncbi:MAG TPA: M56 family metallopeptidase, partial [Flavobacterium sp.]|nr:M56 family metallopeptidase [Flavobacterium sp.]HLW42431.1 M56 family metallopeptidase [Flavobacterium sp.]